MDRAFRSDEHLRRRADFVAIYDRGRKTSGPLMTVFTRRSDRTGPRLGIAATRKLGGSVQRNLAKRLIREVFRHHKPAGGIDVVVVPRREMLDVPYVRLEAEFCALLDGRAPSGFRRPRRSRPHPSV
ncbi:MAG: ribonuclease P protein component [Acidobacteria bacterium]|nr:ribonuclease P protein component [Acidobacteriota bacterium]